NGPFFIGQALRFPGRSEEPLLTLFPLKLSPESSVFFSHPLLQNQSSSYLATKKKATGFSGCFL
ncbi:hypothetical protein LRS37_03470, partial [Neobacillus sedimentimangrovi]